MPIPEIPTTGQPADAQPQVDNTKRNTRIRQQIDACKTYRRKLVQSWSINIDFRRGKPFASQRDEDRISVNLDWSLTKQKQALLFSQVPAVRINHPPQTIAKDTMPWMHAFEQKINDTLLEAGVEAAMDEALPDCINAAGIGVVMVARDAITEDVEVPAIDMSIMPPELHRQVLETGMMPDGSPVPMTTVPRVIDSRYTTSRISPADFLWPINFTGSDFDMAPWLGRSGRISWPEALKRFKLDPNLKTKYLGDERTNVDKLNTDTDKDKISADEMVNFDEIFYKEHQFDTEAKAFAAIHHLVFVGEHETPVIDRVWDGQQLDQDTNQLVGALRYPVRVLTLSYITDDAIPPSDSAIGRAQVNELNKGRSQMIQQREHSIPGTWHDINRVDPMISQALMRGVWQHSIPVQGNGQNVIGSVPRSAMPQENFMFDRIAKSDLSENWQVGQGQSGADIETKGEVNAIQGNMQVRIGRERAKTAKFYVSIAEVLGGLISIYEDPSTFGEGFTPLVSRALRYSILADSTVLLDSSQRLKRLIDFANFMGKTGWMDMESVAKEIATLSGLDPAVAIKPPKSKSPVEPNISLRLTGIEDMLNPMTLAFLMKSGQAPAPELIEQAKKLIETAVTPPMPPQMQGQPGMPPGPSGMPPQGPPGMPPRPGMPPPGAPILGPQGPPMRVPEPPPPEIGEANPQWSALNRVNQRVLDRGEQ